MNEQSALNKHQTFLRDSEKMAFDKDHRATIAFNMTQYENAAKAGKARFVNLPGLRRRAALRKHYVLEHLENHLKNFEHNFTARGGKVIWAQNAEEARQSVLSIFEQHYVKNVVKSKSMTTEEIGLTECLEKNGIESLETDLGEFIVQLTGERPYHIVTPAMHLSAKQIAGVFHKHFGLSEDSSPEEITAFARKHLREKFYRADAGITGANFLVAETGSVAITENEGNALLSISHPRIHIVVAGIEKVLPSLEDLDMFWPLLSAHGTGQSLTAYNSLVNGPVQKGEGEGPRHMYVILLDNGRSRLLGTTPQRRALSCIRCGACLNACPVYCNIGGHAYGTVYSGPIGAVISPHLSGQFREHIHLSNASSLCGKCTEVCPVGIDLHHQLLQNRHLAVKMKMPSRVERYGMKAYKMAMSKRKRLDMVPPGVKNFVASTFFGKAWGPRREMPRVVESFSKRYHGSE